VNQSTLTGHITDATTGQPLVAEVFISGIDDSGGFRYPFRSDTQFGRYYRLLQAGSYTVTYRAEGYEAVTLENVAVNGVGQTVEDVALVPADLPVYPDITANGSNWPLIMRTADNLTLSVTFDSGENWGVQADWWLLAETPEGCFYYNYYISEWLVGQSPAYQGGLHDLASLDVLNTSNLTPGLYTIYFGVDGYKDGQISYGNLFYDSVVVYIMP
jgi:hypothetical protein